MKTKSNEESKKEIPEQLHTRRVFLPGKLQHGSENSFPRVSCPRAIIHNLSITASISVHTSTRKQQEFTVVWVDAGQRLSHRGESNTPQYSDTHTYIWQPRSTRTVPPVGPKFVLILYLM